MSAEKISRRYAAALMDLTDKDLALQVELDNHLTALLELFADKEIRKVIASPIVNMDLMNAVFQNVTGQLKSPEILKQFLRVLVEAHRTALIPGIKEAFHSLLLELQGNAEATVISAIPLDSTEIESIRAKLEGMLDKKIILETKIDKSILGGFVIKIDNSLIDMSLRTKLDNMTKFAVS